jgi:hypothetical protein
MNSSTGKFPTNPIGWGIKIHFQPLCAGRKESRKVLYGREMKVLDEISPWSAECGFTREANCKPKNDCQGTVCAVR